MKITHHAKKRSRQRGFSRTTIDIIQKFGRQKSAPGGALKVFIGNKECQQTIEEFKKAIQLMDKAKNGYLIIAEDNIVTMYK